jgi:hypothetical protein
VLTTTEEDVKDAEVGMSMMRSMIVIKYRELGDKMIINNTG